MPKHFRAVDFFNPAIFGNQSKERDVLRPSTAPAPGSGEQRDRPATVAHPVGFEVNNIHHKA